MCGRLAPVQPSRLVLNDKHDFLEVQYLALPLCSMISASSLSMWSGEQVQWLESGSIWSQGMIPGGKIHMYYNLDVQIAWKDE